MKENRNAAGDAWQHAHDQRVLCITERPFPFRQLGRNLVLYKSLLVPSQSLYTSSTLFPQLAYRIVSQISHHVDIVSCCIRRFGVLGTWLS